MFGFLTAIVGFGLLFAVAMLGLMSSQKAVNKHDATKRARATTADTPSDRPPNSFG